jgi:hypothetical protein
VNSDLLHCFFQSTTLSTSRCVCRCYRQQGGYEHRGTPISEVLRRTVLIACLFDVGVDILCAQGAPAGASSKPEAGGARSPSVSPQGRGRPRSGVPRSRWERSSLRSLRNRGGQFMGQGAPSCLDNRGSCIVPSVKAAFRRATARSKVVRPRLLCQLDDHNDAVGEPIASELVLDLD